MTKPTREELRADLRRMLNKVPEITLYFWVIKVLCTTVGETASDYLADNLSLGLTKTTFITGGAPDRRRSSFQFRLGATSPAIYWLGDRPDQRRRHADHRQPDRQPRRLARRRPRSSSAIVLAIVFAVWFAERADAVDPHDLHDPARGASTGSPSSSRSRSAPPPAT